MRMYKKRVKGYEAIGYSMQNGPENSKRQSDEYEYLQIDEAWRNGEFWLCPYCAHAEKIEADSWQLIPSIVIGEKTPPQKPNS